MDAREEGRLTITPCYWHHLSTALYGALGYETGLLSGPPYEPTCITRLAHDNSHVTQYHRALALPRP